MNNNRTYIIGKITGLDRKQVERKFASVEKLLEGESLEIINPLLLVPEDTSWNAAMRVCIATLIECDSFVLIPDWYLSRGAKIEYMIASSLGLLEVRL
jgi:hypothetical protein